MEVGTMKLERLDDDTLDDDTLDDTLDDDALEGGYVISVKGQYVV